MTVNMRRWMVLLSGTLLLTACNSQELTRDKARKLINASSEIAPAKSAWIIDYNRLQCGVKKGLWRLGLTFLTPTEAAKGSIASIERVSETGYKVVLAKPMKRELIAVTGITDAPSAFGPHAKLVSYNWRWLTETFKNDYPDSVVQCMGTLPSETIEAHALMKLYDDGWRVETITPLQCLQYPELGCAR